MIAAIAIIFVSIQKSEAFEAEIHAGVSFVESLSLVAEQLEFGTLTFTEDASANDVTIAADGSLTCSNTTDYTCPSKGKAGQVSIAGGLGSIVNISCGGNAKLSNGAETLNLEQIKLSNGTTSAICGGINSTAISIPLIGNVDQDLFKVGAKLVIPETGVTGATTYSTANSGGEAISIRIAYQ